MSEHRQTAVDALAPVCAAAYRADAPAMDRHCAALAGRELAEEIVDSITAHAVETARDLIRAEEEHGQRST